MEKLTPSKLSRRLTFASLLLPIVFVLLAPSSAIACYNLKSSTLERKADNYRKTIRSASRRYGVREDLIKAVITVESCFQRKARGLDGEKGLMQLMPATARRFDVKSGYNSWQNIHGGTQYLSYLLKRYNGNTTRTLAAYNAGEGRIKKSGRIFNMGYVNKVMKAYGKFSGQSKKSLNKHPKKLKKSKVLAKKAPAKVKQKITPVRALPWGDKPMQRRQITNANSGRYFQVQDGHTVYAVMRSTGVPVEQIIKLNGLSKPYHLESGQRLRLP